MSHNLWQIWTNTVIFIFTRPTLASTGKIPTVEQAQSLNSKYSSYEKVLKKGNIYMWKRRDMIERNRYFVSLSSLCQCSLQSLSQKEQLWAKTSFHPEPIWSDQTEKFSGRRSHTHQQMLWLPVELPTSRHEPWLTASWWLNGYTSLPSEVLACKAGFIQSGWYFQFFCTTSNFCSLY